MHKEYTENRVIFQDYVVVQNIGLVDGQVMGHVMGSWGARILGFQSI